MKILSMQATFGKLDNETIIFSPDLNVIHAPNEWGKSTWCAFIAAMLYGIDTRERTTQTALADKEHYAPWSGKPMSGRMEVEWNGKNITIERSSKGRTPFGVFSAYETESGLPVAELTGDNCGLMLLGVEKSVFLKSAFIRQNDMPVAQDETLRRRLNALVTTGDESNTGDQLAQKLKDLKNACRHNKTGQLPQAEEKQRLTQGKLDQLRDLQSQATQLTQQLQELEGQIHKLENHKDALSYAAAQNDLQQVNSARERSQAARRAADDLKNICAALPAQQEAEEKLSQLSQLQEQLNNRQHQQPIPLPQPPAQKAPFHGLDAQQAKAMVDRDHWQYAALKSFKQFIPYILIALAGLAIAVALTFAEPQIAKWRWVAAVLGAIPLLIMRINHTNNLKYCIELEGKYGSNNPNLWYAAAQAHTEELERYATAMENYEAQRLQQQKDTQALEEKVLAITQGAPVTAARNYWEQVRSRYKELQDALIAAARAEEHANAMASMVRTAQPPKEPDDLTFTEEETTAFLSRYIRQRELMRTQLGNVQGQTVSLGDEETLQRELSALSQRIAKLKTVENALILAQQTLEVAAKELQRQYAPQIANRAKELVGRMTSGRYDRLTLDQNLALQAGAAGETNLQSWFWRSDGTVDQLYLALRLAVAEVLTPDAPLILDDALVRFDDNRMENALQILSEVAIHRQVILFSCQNREKSWKNT